MVIGAGASGLMFASLVKNKKIAILETNSKIGQKIKVSGGAKCNITNEYLTEANYLGDEIFIKKSLECFSNKDLLKFLNKNNVYPTLNPKIVKGTYFCNSSQDVLSMFEKLTSHVKKFFDTKVLSVEYNKHFLIKTQNTTYEAKKLVVASGGLSFPSLGASSIAYDIAKYFGHEVSTIKPALVGFTVQKEQFWFKKLSGISCEVKMKVENKEFLGKLLFAHKGCSGPAVLNSSLYWNKGKITIDFLPKSKLDKYLKGNKNISTALPLPKRFILEFLESINLKDKTVSKLTKDEKNSLSLLKNYDFSPAGTFGYSKAEVTSGGIDTNEINPETFESKKREGLFFLGECLEPTGQLGGYNFQLYFSQAFLAAKNF
ncbi:BaiN/RdsA family NAD(P)/FAD-dependent oxidoreductase [Halarcobacter mediterraneus]|uniref:NAD(P)/FAD-dependent oxidoreductase n=1 Tax=Halarcobacter mediterraneus TaxID=2023153 RepID=UPI0022659FF5|nr:aminoacetone oxidase family FAD-binding enzyme [Halarcobacter mediterraneus]